VDRQPAGNAAGRSVIYNYKKEEGALFILCNLAFHISL